MQKKLGVVNESLVFLMENRTNKMQVEFSGRSYFHGY